MTKQIKANFQTGNVAIHTPIQFSILPLQNLDFKQKKTYANSVLDKNPLIQILTIDVGD